MIKPSVMRTWIIPCGFFFVFEDISKLISVPIFEPKFDVFQSLMQKEHISSLNGYILCPPFTNIVGEFRVREAGIFKPERSISRCAHKGGFQLYRPVV